MISRQLGSRGALLVSLVASFGCEMQSADPEAADTSAGAPIVAEAEALGRTSNVQMLVESDAAYSAGKSLKVFGTGPGSYVELAVPNVPAGDYAVAVYYKRLDNRPIAELAIGGARVGGAFDMYGATPAWQVAASLGTWHATTAQSLQVRITATGKHASSAGYTMHVDKLVLTPQGGATAATRIVNANSGKCVDIANSGSANGTNIQQWTCNGTGAQLFELVADGAGVRVRNPQSGKCVDVTNNGTANGTNIQLWTCNGGAAQRFVRTNATGRTAIKHLASGKCVDVASSGTADGTNVQLWECNGTNAQQFDLGEGNGTGDVLDECKSPKPGWLFCDGFESTVTYDGDTKQAPIVTASGPSKLPGNHVMRFRSPPGQRGGAGVWKAVPPNDRMYARFYVQWEPGYKPSAPNHGPGGLGADATQWYKGSSGSRPKGDDYYMPGMEFSTKSPNPLYGYSYYRGMYQDCTNPVGQCWGDSLPCVYGGNYCKKPQHLPTVAQPPYQTGRWYCIEEYIDAGTPTSDGSGANGVFRFWVDGQQIGNITDLWLRTTASLKTNFIWLYLFNHDGTHSIPGMLIDDVVVSTERVGCRQ